MGGSECTYPEKARVIHAIFMIFGWWFCITPAILFARYFKGFWESKLWFGTKIWFQLHRGLNVTGVTLVAAGLLTILIQNCWQWEGVKPGAEGNHAIVGLTAAIIAFVQPIGALLRPAPDHPQRIIFNWLHRSFGIIGWLLASVAIWIASDIEYNYLLPQFPFGLAPKATIVFYWCIIVFSVVALEFYPRFSNGRSGRYYLFDSENPPTVSLIPNFEDYDACTRPRYTLGSTTPFDASVDLTSESKTIESKRVVAVQYIAIGAVLFFGLLIAILLSYFVASQEGGYPEPANVTTPQP